MVHVGNVDPYIVLSTFLQIAIGQRPPSSISCTTPTPPVATHLDKDKIEARDNYRKVCNFRHNSSSDYVAENFANILTLLPHSIVSIIRAFMLYIVMWYYAP
ncbi:hypothetical protein EV424DRAFT_1341063 [Suillus variegatus]|nr:hypothetical protein EV424DRAFT_1341063 [Suillus variegatus]